MSCKQGGCAGLLLLAAVGSGCEGDPPPPRRHEVTINGRTWRVELAVTPDDRYRGLGGRASLAEDAGMLFVFPWTETQEFCMRDCLIPLDIAFIGADLRVVKTHTMAVEPNAYSYTGYRSVESAQYALEVPAGALARAGVKVGDRVEFSENIPLSAKE